MASFHLEIASQYLEFNGKVKYLFIIIQKTQQFAAVSRVFARGSARRVRREGQGQKEG